MMFNKKNLCLLENEYNNQSDTFMYVVHGNRGLGKTYTINEFLSDKKDVLRICFTDESAFALEPVVSAISSFSKCSADSLMLSDLGLNFKDVLLKQLLSLCHNQRMIIYFENLANCERVQIEFLINFLKKTQHADIKKPFVIFATAPSMDGFASDSAPLIDNGFKISYPCRQPKIVLADTKILAAAPVTLPLSLSTALLFTTQ